MVDFIDNILFVLDYARFRRIYIGVACTFLWIIVGVRMCNTPTAAWIFILSSFVVGIATTLWWHAHTENTSDDGH